jgi:GTP-binding protein
MWFTDKVQIQLYAGKGGDGVVAWRREKYIPKGGPTGGNGGKGGSVYLEADEQTPSLDYYRNRKILKAENGGNGGPNNRQGKTGKDIVLKVPRGTLVKNAATGTLIADLTEDKESILLCKGGKGGLGNDFFKTATNRAPNYCTPGKPGEELQVELELKLIADVGFVGYPNAGKSTLINTLTNVKVKTADYPFTTLRPNLGFIELENGQRIFIADIPGIIEGAHRNRGLGFEFLRHIERTKLLIFLLDASGIDGRTPADDLIVLKEELRKYNPELIERPYLVVLNKCDDPESARHIEQFYSVHKNEKKERIFEISAILYENVDSLKNAIRRQLNR